MVIECVFLWVFVCVREREKEREKMKLEDHGFAFISTKEAKCAGDSIKCITKMICAITLRLFRPFGKL